MSQASFYPRHFHFGIRAQRKDHGEGCDILVQTSLSGPCIQTDEADLEQIRAKGHGALLDRTFNEAIETGEATTNRIAPGSKKDDAPEAPHPQPACLFE